MKDNVRPVDARGIGLSSPADPVEQSLYEVRAKIHPRAVQGWFAAWRWTKDGMNSGSRKRGSRTRFAATSSRPESAR
ncbi:MAG: hypothetical protein EB141_10770 [Verrucomicrobia bacterium]|nr:hypothetical protein [Verrucomicrobiota bacterium]